jgi:hypothetical protein
MCAAVSIVGFYYPLFVVFRFAECDDLHTGMLLYLVLPFSGVAGFFSAILVYRLIRGLKSVQTQWRYLAGFMGVVLAIPNIVAGLLIGTVSVIITCFIAKDRCRDLLFYLTSR